MSPDFELLARDETIKDRLYKIGSLFNVSLELLPGYGPAPKTEHESKKILNSCCLTLEGTVVARLHVYSIPGGQKQSRKQTDTIEKMVMEMIEKIFGIAGLHCEPSGAHDEIQLYQKLGEQILQPDNVAESYGIILAAAESLLKTGKTAIMLKNADNERLRPAAFREYGKNLRAGDGDYLPCDMYIEKIKGEMKPVIVPNNHTCTFLAVKGGSNITFKGPLLAAPVIRRQSDGDNSVTGYIIATGRDGGKSGFNLCQINTIITLASFAAIAGKHFESLETSRAALFEIDNMLKDLVGTFESLQQHTALIDRVNQVSLKVNSTLDLDSIFKLIADYSRDLLGCEAAILGVTDQSGNVTFPSQSGLPIERLDKTVDLEKLPMIRQSIHEARSIIVNRCDPIKVRLGTELSIDIRNLVVYPIVSNNQVPAVIIALNKKEGNGGIFTATDAELLKTLAGQAANAIENGRLLNNITQTQITVMTKLATLAEKRDYETGKHLLRMQKYSRIISQELAESGKYSAIVDERFINDIYNASPLHDIGKVGISDSILLKQGKLTVEEFDIMRSHTTIGAEILQGPKYLEMAADIARCHHEKWDGSGYPRGLNDEHIPLSARIVAVADAYDAITSRRTYKKSLPHDIAVEAIIDGRTGHFDPMVVDAFLGSLAGILQVKNSSGSRLADEDIPLHEQTAPA